MTDHSEDPDTTKRPRVRQVLGPIVDVAFPSGHPLPALGHALRVALGARTAGSPAPVDITLEVTHHLGRGIVRTIALHPTEGLSRGTPVTDTGEPLRVPLAPDCLGRIFDALGEPADGLGPTPTRARTTASPSARWAAARRPRAPMITGIKAIDLLAPCPHGGKLGIFGGAGTGKSRLVLELLNNVARGHGGVVCFAGVGGNAGLQEDIIGEMASSHLETGETLLSAAVFVIAAPDAAPGARARAVHTAVSIAEQFRDELRTDVFFVVDDVSRAAQASAEVAIMQGRGTDPLGYPATLATEMGVLQERLFSTADAALTSVQTLHTPADDPRDPAVAAAFDHFDARVVLSRDLATEGIFPAIDPLASTSTLLVPEVVGERHHACAVRVRAALAAHRDLAARASMPGSGPWDEDERVLVARARKLRAFLGQPFFVAAGATGRHGRLVRLEDTIAGCEAILEGQLDALEEEAFRLVGEAPRAG